MSQHHNNMNFFAECDVKVAPKFYQYKQAVGKPIPVNRICFCCRITDVPLVKLSGCSHYEYLMCYFLKHINVSKTMVCLYCHNILKNIEKFKKQVENCILNSQQPIRTNIINKLQISETVTISINPEDLKPVIDNSIYIPETVVQDLNVDIKEEYLSDESTKSAFEDVNMMEEGQIHLEPNFKRLLDVDHNYALTDPILKQQSLLNMSVSPKKTIKTVRVIQLELENKPSTSKPVEKHDHHTIRSGNCAVPNINVQPTTSSSVMRSPKQRRTARTQILMRNKNPRAGNVRKNTKPIFQCRLCYAKFEIESAYDNHLKEHEKVSLTKSDLCGKIRMVYLNREEMEREREKRRLMGYMKLDHKCEDCITSFHHEDSLKNHMKKHDTSKSKHVCEICKCVYLTEKGLKFHSVSHWRRFQCMECGEKFLQDILCIAHYNKEHGKDGKRIDDYYSCYYMDCDYIANDYSSYKRHIRQKHRKKVPCNICGKNFNNITSMKHHVLSIHEKIRNRIYKCNECDKQYNNNSGLILHIRSRHQNNLEEEIAYCKDCDKHFRVKHHLDVHLRTHSRHVRDDMKKYICDICGEKFVNKQAVRSHIEMKHLGVTFECGMCNKILTSTRALMKHERDKHSGAPRPSPPDPKLCQICGKGFKHAISLKSHIYSHTGERPLQCTRCPATFIYKASLYTHNRLVHKVPKKNK